MHYKIAVVALAALSLTACGSSEKKAKVTLAPLPEVQQPVSAAKQWSASPGAEQGQYWLNLKPAADDKAVYTADKKGRILARTLEKGKKLWRQETDYRLGAGPAVSADLVIVGSRDAEVLALDKHTGTPQWAQLLSGEVLASPVVSDEYNTVYIHAVDGSLSALDLTDGRIRWVVDHPVPALSLRGASAPAIVGSSVVIGYADGKVAAFDAQTGAMRWEKALATPQGRTDIQRMVDINADPVGVGENVYVVSYQGKLAAMSAATGQLLWQQNASSYQNIAVDADYVYVTDAKDAVWAYDRNSGASVWKQEQLKGRQLTGPAVDGQTVVLADSKGYVHWLSKDNGQWRDYRHLGGKGFHAAPLKHENQWFLATIDGRLVTLKQQEQ